LAVLTEPQRREVVRLFMQRMSRDCDPMPPDKFDLKDTVDAIDNWVETNWATLLGQFPAETQSLSGKEKAELIYMVIRRKWEVL
jgi:hypothetical protein